MLKFILLLLISASSSTPTHIDQSLNRLFEQLDTCNFVITSGKRSPEHNKKVGGSRNSYHLTDRARDISSTDSCRIKLGELAWNNGLSVIYYRRHIHADNRDNQVCLVKSEGKGFKYCNIEESGNER